jgi:hypothetical protein
MSIVSLRFDGWLMLPAQARAHLGVTTGHHLEVELIDGALLLRPAAQGATLSGLETKEAPGTAAPTKQAPAGVGMAVSKTGPGRPRKAAVQELTPRIKVGGRRKSARPT